MSELPAKKVLIIGAGIAGLCAGVHARRCGFETEIVEMGQASGGLATSWRRGDYTFENCIHWLLGSNPSSPYYRLWQEIFDIQKVKFIDSEDFAIIEGEHGERLRISKDTDQLELELLRVAPEDSLAIKRLVRGVRRLGNCDVPLSSENRLAYYAQLVKMIPHLPEIHYWTKMTAQELGSQFKNPLLRQFFGGGDQGKMSALALVFSMAWMSKKDAGYPIGGSQALIRLIEQNYRELGGEIRFQAKVSRILIENDRAVGAVLEDGGVIRADWVVSAADGHTTLFDWIPARYRDAKAEEPYRSLPTFPSYLQISLGIRRDLKQEPGYLLRVLETPIAVDPGTDARQLAFRFFNFDPTFAPSGKTAVVCFISTFNYEYWTALRASDPSAYAARKAEIAQAVIAVLERRTPGIRGDVEIVDVSTPASVINHTGNWKGSMEGFMMTPAAGFSPLRATLPGLGNFRMIGQWVQPGGGLPSGLMTGRSCIQEICLAEDRPFRAGVPASAGGPVDANRKFY